MKSSSIAALVILSALSSSAQAGILDWFGRLPGQETLKEHAGNYVIREDVTFQGDVGRARSQMTRIYNMSEWSPLTNFRGQTDVGRLPIASVTTSSGTEEVNLIVTEDTYTDNSQTLCARSTGLLYNQQFCYRLFIQDNGDMVYETEILFDGIGIIKAKSNEDEIRKALRAEADGFADHVETADARNEQAKLDNARTDELNKMLTEMQELENRADRAAKDVRMFQAEAKRLREVAAEFEASSMQLQRETAPIRRAEAVEQDKKAVASEKKSAELRAKAEELRAKLRAQGVQI